MAGFANAKINVTSPFEMVTRAIYTQDSPTKENRLGLMNILHQQVEQ